MNQKLLLLANLLLRLFILAFLIEAVASPADPRFAGKAIAGRNFVIGTLGTLVIPFLYFRSRLPFRRRGAAYPYLTDIAYLSIFALDMAGNSLNLYNSIFWFDLVPHFHGTGVGTVIFYLLVLARNVFGKINLSRFEAFLLAFGLATILHVAIEANEFYTDVFLGTHNVRGVFDVINDLVAGFFGSFVYVGVFEVFAKNKTGAQIKKMLAPLASLLGLILLA